ncbi:MAG TPA: sigma 54-interacting transcriptional regulator [Blastocatellia bacterium]|nr:sigma 54-interacting transcriptional regulator [Blastocatellia bacterium]
MASRDVLGSHRIEEAMAAGQAALDDSRLEEAVDHFRSALKMGPRSAEAEALIRCSLSEALEKRGMHIEQLDAVAKYDSFPDFVRLSERTQMRVLVRLGWAHSFNNNIPRAIALFNQAMPIAQRLKDNAWIGGCYFGLGRAYRFVSEIRIARDQYASALEHFRQAGGWRDLADCYFNIGSIDFREGDHRAALNCINQALTIVGDRKEHELLGRAYNDLALIYDNVELPTNRAIAAWEKCIEHFREAGKPLHLAINYNNFAYRLMGLGDWYRAEELLKSAMELLRQTSRVAQLAGTIDTFAQLCLLQGRIEEADRLLEESLELFESIKGYNPMTRDNPLESCTYTTIGRSHLIKGHIPEATESLERAIEIALRLGDRQYLTEARLWLAEALLQAGNTERARVVLDEVRATLRETPDMLTWGPMMRMIAKLEAADNHIASAIQSLGQSTSIFEIRGSVYDRALNRAVLAGMLDKQGKLREAVAETKASLAVFERLGARVDERAARDYLVSLHERQHSHPSPSQSHAPTAPDLASGVDGFIAQRLVQASVSRELLLHELASIARDQSMGRAALIAEMRQQEGADREGARPEIAASVGLNDREVATEVKFLAYLPPQNYARHFVYAFADHHGSNYALRIIEPQADRFRAGSVNLEPLLRLAEQGLENQILKGQTRRQKVFNPARVLAEVELPGFICSSRAMSRVLEQIHKIRSSDVTVLITGESGTGKELIARAVHAGSSRRMNVFLPFNCSAAPREMIESQLFGFRKGAFTGAIANNAGIIRAAEGGTLLLDEIGDLPLDLQPKLLRFLQEGEIHPLGENQPTHVDVRVVTATNMNLERAVAEGRFREDLFHRLNVIRIHVPPLRERREEIPSLANHYLDLYQQEASKAGVQLSEETVDLMVVYDWPGNVRQLCNEIRRIVAYADPGTVVSPDALSPEIARAIQQRPPSSGSQRALTGPTLVPPPSGTTLGEAVEELERRMISDALDRSRGNIARAAKELGLSRKGLYLKMDRLNFRS